MVDAYFFNFHFLYREVDPFHLVIQSEDESLVWNIQAALDRSGRFCRLDVLPDAAIIRARITIVDCRRGLPAGAHANFDMQHGGGNWLALINPHLSARRAAYRSGYADYMSWPVLEAELCARLEARCAALSTTFPGYRFSPVTLVEECCAFLVKDLAQPVSIHTLARKLGTNHNTLTIQFKKELGLPPVSWLRRTRMEVAARSLRRTRWPISAIAAAVGYERPENFTTAFRRHHGLSPSKYRRDEQRKEENE